MCSHVAMLEPGGAQSQAWYYSKCTWLNQIHARVLNNLPVSSGYKVAEYGETGTARLETPMQQTTNAANQDALRNVH